VGFSNSSKRFKKILKHVEKIKNVKNVKKTGKNKKVKKVYFYIYDCQRPPVRTDSEQRMTKDERCEVANSD